MLKCDHSNESYWAVLSCGTVYYVAQGGSYVWEINSRVCQFKVLWQCFVMLLFVFQYGTG